MQDHKERLSKAFKNLVTGFISYPEDAELEVEDQEHKGIYTTVKCNRADRSRLIGKKGRNARAMEEILKAIADGIGTRIPFSYMVLEGHVGSEQAEQDFQYDTKWKLEHSKAFANRVKETLVLFDPAVSVKARDPVYGTTVVEITSGVAYGPALKISLMDIFGAIGRNFGREIKLEINVGTGAVLPPGLLAR